MKRYLVFSGDTYYAKGGFRDYIDSFDSIERATQKADELKADDVDWVHIFDSEEGKVVYDYGIAQYQTLTQPERESLLSMGFEQA